MTDRCCSQHVDATVYLIEDEDEGGTDDDGDADGDVQRRAVLLGAGTGLWYVECGYGIQRDICALL